MRRSKVVAMRSAGLRLKHARHYLRASYEDLKSAGVGSDVAHVRQLLKWSMFAAGDAVDQLRITYTRAMCSRARK